MKISFLINLLTFFFSSFFRVSGPSHYVFVIRMLYNNSSALGAEIRVRGGTMKKIVSFVFILLSFAVVSSSAATPVRLSLIPSLAIPQDKTVHGLDFSLIYDSVHETQGVQLAWIYGNCENKMVGIQWGLVVKTKQLTGLQDGFVCLSDDVKGVQWGFYNSAKNVSGLQLGFINVTENMNGIQIGLVNHIKNSKLPWMIIANAKFK